MNSSIVALCHTKLNKFQYLLDLMSRLQTVETYDSFRPEFLLSVKFRRAEDYDLPFIRTFRTSYASMLQVYNGMTKLQEEQLEEVCVDDGIRLSESES